MGVQKSKCARPLLAKARASVLMMMPILSTRGSSKAAEEVMACGNCVAALNWPPQVMPRLWATPWRASFHHWYALRPSLETPGELLKHRQCRARKPIPGIL